MSQKGVSLMAKDTLTAKQEKFVQGLIEGKSQRESYRAAYPASVKWLDKSVDEKASTMMKNVKVLSRYEALHGRLIKEAEDDCIITAKQVLQELANIALANGSDYAQVVEREYEEENEGGETVKKRYKTVNLIPTESLSDNRKSAIAGIEQTQSGIRVKQHDKVKALELLGKHLGMFTDKMELTGKGGGPIQHEDVSLEEKLKFIESLKNT
ncbi:MAG: terminase small subunit [Eubacteriales bacterium]|nr:terminase small subunit [Eubacteriales bacterium]